LVKEKGGSKILAKTLVALTACMRSSL